MKTSMLVSGGEIAMVRFRLPQWLLIVFGAILFAAGLLGLPVAALADYRVAAGDVIEVSVARIPELQRRAPVQLDGSISLPLLGTVAVAGLSPAEIQSKVQVGLAAKIFRQRLPDGRENAVAIEPDEVTVTIVYRPIYVNGDVAKPGEQAFRPFMTVRQAIALSGGYDMLRTRMENPVMLSADLKSEYESLWIEFVKEQARLSRLKAELGDKSTPSQKLDGGIPVRQSVLADIVKTESDQLATSEKDYQKEQAFLRSAIQQADEQIGILSTQEKKEEQGAQADVEELQRATELYSKGTLTSPRVTDARRAVLLSSTRKLQTTAQLLQVKKQQGEYSRQLERLGDQRRIKLLDDVADSVAKLGSLRAKLEGVGEKLQYTGAMKADLAQGRASGPRITVVRRGATGWVHSDATEDTELQPGDVVEISLRSQQPFGTASQ
jgi:polysaccharide export outer membrane protein